MAAFQKNNESIFCLDFSPAGLIYHVSHMPFSLEAFQGFQVSCEAFLLRSCSVLNYVYAYFKKNYLLGQVLVGKWEAKWFWNINFEVQKEERTNQFLLLCTSNVHCMPISNAWDTSWEVWRQNLGIDTLFPAPTLLWSLSIHSTPINIPRGYDVLVCVGD